MNVKIPAGESLRHAFLHTEIHHVEATRRDHARHRHLSCGIQPLRPGGEHTANQLVRPLGRGDVQHAGNHAAADQCLHRPTTSAGGGKDQHFVTGFFKNPFRLALGDFEENVKKSEKEALANYQKGADKAQADCMLRVAAFHFEGKGGLEKSEEKGREWLVKAAEAGNALAALEMASRLSKAEKPEMLSVYKYLLSAANTGLPVAQNEIGLLYVSGNLGLSDPTAAVAWFTAAAKAGHAAAQNNLGTLYERGMGVPVDYNNAGQLYSLAANQGHAAATTGLARLHATGHGTEQSLPKAWALASLAIERGDNEAKTLLGDLTSKMNEEQISQGKKELEVLKKPAAEKPAGDKPAGDKPAADKDKSTSGKPAGEKATAVTPAIEIPAPEEPKEEKKDK